MEFWSTIAGLMRRRTVIIPTVLVALALGVFAYKSTPATYTSSTTMVLTPTEYGSTESQDPNKPTELTNPMMNFNGSLQTTSAILIESMSTKDTLQQLGATRGSTQLVINDGRTNPALLGLSGPFLYIEGRSPSASDAQRIVVDAQRLMREKLKAWQGTLNAPQKTYVSLVDVVSPTSPVRGTGRATKMGMLAFLFGFVLCLGIAHAGHQLRSRRRALATAEAPKLLDEAAEAAAVGKTRDPAAATGRGRPYAPLVQDAQEEELEHLAVPTPLKTHTQSSLALEEAASPARTPQTKIARFRDR